MKRALAALCGLSISAGAALLHPAVGLIAAGTYGLAALYVDAYLSARAK